MMGKEEKMDPPPPYPVANFNLKNLDSNTTQGPPKTVHGVIHVTNPPVGPKPVIVICSSCKQTVKTQVVYEPSTKTHLACLLLCVLQCYLCFCLPYQHCCQQCCQSGVHSCSNCSAYIGTYSR